MDFAKPLLLSLFLLFSSSLFVSDLALAQSDYQLILLKTDRVTDVTSDPIWELSLYNQDKALESLPALVGRKGTQTIDRMVRGNQSPLPAGVYFVARLGTVHSPFLNPEIGKGFYIPLVAEFKTKRRGFAIHHDPSWNVNNGQSGTEGCIGLESEKATIQVLNWIKKYKITKLEVKN